MVSDGLTMYTIGLNDPGDGPGSARPGSLVDTENMATAGRYLDDNPVNAVVIVMDASNPRCDAVLSRLIHIIVGKVHRRDYDKIMVVVNKYSHSPYMVNWRKEQCPPDQLGTEKEHQKQIKDEIVESFACKLCLPSYDLVAFPVYLLRLLQLQPSSPAAEAYIHTRNSNVDAILTQGRICSRLLPTCKAICILYLLTLC